MEYSTLFSNNRWYTGNISCFTIFGSSISSSVTLPSDGNISRAFILEIVMTFTLVYIVLTTGETASNKIAPLAGLAICLTLGFNVIFGGSISGSFLNPARSFGLALISGNFSYNWIYWIAPVIGSLLQQAFIDYCMQNRINE